MIYVNMLRRNLIFPTRLMINSGIFQSFDNIVFQTWIEASTPLLSLMIYASPGLVQPIGEGG